MPVKKKDAPQHSDSSTSIAQVRGVIVSDGARCGAKVAIFDLSPLY
jgi:hypothetical protein